MSTGARERHYINIGIRKSTMPMLRKELKMINRSQQGFINELIENYFFRKYGINPLNVENLDWDRIRHSYTAETQLFLQDFMANLKPNKIEVAQDVVLPKDFKK